MLQSNEPKFFRAEEMIQQIRITLLQLVLGFIILAGGFFTLSLVASGQNLLEMPDATAPMAVLVAAIMFYIVWRKQFLELIGVFVIIYLGATGLFLSLQSGDIGLLFPMLSLASIAAAFVLRREFFLL